MNDTDKETEDSVESQDSQGQFEAAEADFEELDNDEVQSQTAEAPARSGWGPALATGFLAIAVALGAAWWLYQVMFGLSAGTTSNAETLAALGDKTDDALGRLGSLSSQVSEVEAGVKTLSGLEGKLAGVYDSRFEQLADSVSELSAKQRADDKDWVLAQIEYLLFAANERLQLEGDVGAALAAMKAADVRIELLNDPALIPVREQLVSDMNALKGVKVPDMAGLALYFADLTRRIDELPLRELELGKAPDVVADDVMSEAKEGVSALLARAWDDLVDLVDVETLEIPDAVITDPEGRRLLIETLRTECVTARLSVMRRDTENLKASAELLSALIDQYFDKNSAAVTSALETLREMQNLELAPSIPETSGSLNAIRAARASA